MTLIKFLTVCILSCCSLTGYSQVADSSIYRTQADTVKPHKITNISVGNYFHLLKDDFVQQAEAPFNIRRRQLLRVAGFAVITAAVMRYDEPINHVDLRIVAKSSAVRAISPVVTNFGGKYEVYMIGAIGAWSYLFKNDQLKTATLLATQSYITSGVWVSVLKFVAGRSRPLYFDVHTQEDESIWHEYPMGANSSIQQRLAHRLKQDYREQTLGIRCVGRIGAWLSMWQTGSKKLQEV
jgi:hypothetical protein